MNKKLSTLYLLSFMMPMTILLISVGLPDMAKEYSAIKDIAFYLKVIMVAPAFLMFLLAPYIPEIARKFGYVRSLAIGLVIYGVFGLAGLAVGDLSTLFASRLLLGLGAGIVAAMPMMLAVLYFKGDALTNFLGHRGAMLSLGATGATIIGGFLAEFGWRYTFLGYLLAFAGLFMVVKFLPEPSLSKEEVLEEAEEEKVKIASVLKRAFIVYFTVIMMMMVFYVLPVHLPFIMIDRMALQPSVVGISLGVVAMISAYVSHRYLDIENRIARKTQFVMIFGFQGVAYLLLFASTAFYDNLTVAMVFIMAALVLVGVGSGILRPLSYNWLLEKVPSNQHQKALSLYISTLSLTLFITPFFMEPFLRILGDAHSFLLVGGVLGFLSLATALRPAK